MSKPTVVILLTPEMRAKLIPASAHERLAEVANVRAPTEGELTPENLQLVEGAVAAITGWGTPPLDETLLAHAKSLKLVAHAAGSIRHLVPFAAIEEGRLQVHMRQFILARLLPSLWWRKYCHFCVVLPSLLWECAITNPGSICGRACWGVSLESKR